MDEHEAGRRRLADSREAQKNEKVFLTIFLLAAITCSILYVDSLHLHSRKAIAGAVLIATVVPTVLVLVFYDRIASLLGRIRRGRAHEDGL